MYNFENMLISSLHGNIHSTKQSSILEEIASHTCPAPSLTGRCQGRTLAMTESSYTINGIPRHRRRGSQKTNSEGGESFFEKVPVQSRHLSLRYYFMENKERLPVTGVPI